jgi:hypothetical protein
MLQSGTILRDPCPKDKNQSFEVQTSSPSLMHLHLINLLSKNANKNVFLQPETQLPLPLKFKSVYAPKIFPSTSLIIVIVSPLFLHLSINVYP